MKSLIRKLYVLASTILMLGSALAQEQGTKQEAAAMVEAAVAHVKKVGADKAFDDFNKDKAHWTKKDLYVFALDFEGHQTANGANEKLVGKSILGLKDPNGKEHVKEMISVASTKGEGWVDYDWPNPVTKKVQAKSAFVKRIPDANALVGVGIYR